VDAIGGRHDWPFGGEGESTVLPQIGHFHTCGTSIGDVSKEQRSGDPCVLEGSMESAMPTHWQQLSSLWLSRSGFIR